MPSEVFEDWIELSIGLLEAEAPDPARPDLCGRSYPLPRLRTTGQVEKRKFRVIVLENELLSVHIAPDLGGRIIRFIDKQFNKDILPLPDQLLPQNGGIRGAELPLGIQVRTQRRDDRANSMGSVFFQIEEPADEDMPAAVWIGETESGTDLGLTLRYSLAPDRLEVLCQVRAFNRSLDALPYDPSVTAQVEGKAYFAPSGGGVLTFDAERSCGLALWPGDEPMDSSSFQSGTACLNRFAAGLEKQLGPRQLDVWTVKVQPIAGVTTLTGASPEAYYGKSGQELTLRSIADRPSHEVFLLTSEGATLTCPSDLSPAKALSLTLDQDPTALLIRDANKVEILRSEGELEQLTNWSAVVADAPPPAVLPRNLPEKALQRATFEPALKHQAHLHLGMSLLGQGRYEEAALEFESALLYNAEDTLTWWAKAVALRLSGFDSPENNDLLNAHFLSPLEPLLRAEGFLAQPQSMDKDKNPLLNSLEDGPEAFIDIAAQLISHGLIKEAGRWIDEALRHQDMPMLRYLLAFCHLKGSGMQFEAAHEVKLASEKPLAPPYPWRHTELEALTMLAEAFATDERLNEMLRLTRLLDPEPARTF